MRYSLLCVVFLVFAAPAFGQLEERNRAIAHYQAGEYESAISILEVLRSGKQADHLSLLHLAASYNKSHDGPRAVAILQELDRAVAELGKFEYQKELTVLRRPRAGCGKERTGPQTLKLLVEFGSDGKIGFLLPFNDKMSSFVTNALTAAQAIEFEPARVNNKNVPVLRVLQYDCRYF